MQKYQFTKEMGEISGFGGSYEEACRKMIIAGVEWLDQNPSADLSYKEFKNIYGITTDESEDVKKLQKTMADILGEDGPTGAMMQACLGHISFIKKNGWEKYVEKSSGTTN